MIFHMRTTPSVDDLKKLRKPIPRINVEHRQKLNRLERIALWITEHVGTMGFFLIIFTWTFGWLLWNTFAPEELRFDPFPAFVLWLFISNMIQIMLMPLIMIGQNLQARHASARADAQFEINTRTERENEVILQQLENQQEQLAKLVSALPPVRGDGRRGE